MRRRKLRPRTDALDQAIQRIEDDVSRVFLVIDEIRSAWRRGAIENAMDLVDDLEDLEQVLCHPSPSQWLRDAIREALAEEWISA